MFFLSRARQHSYACRARYCFTTLSVCLSVCPMPVLCQNEWAYRHTFWRSGRGIILVAPPPLQISKRTPQWGRLIQEGGKMQMSPFIAEMVRDRAIVTYETIRGSHRYPIDPCQFQWPWVTLEGGTCGKFFTGRPRMLTLDLFAVAKLLL